MTLLFNVTSVEANLSDVYPPAWMGYNLSAFFSSLTVKKHRWSDCLCIAITLEGVQSHLIQSQLC